MQMYKCTPYMLNIYWWSLLLYLAAKITIQMFVSILIVSFIYFYMFTPVTDHPRADNPDISTTGLR